MTTGKNKDTEERKRLYESARKEILDARTQNMNNLGKSILTLSSGAIGVSLFFLKYHVSTGAQQDKSYVYLLVSWVSLVSAILFIVLSYLFGGFAADKQLKIAEDYYLNGKGMRLNKFNFWTNFFNITGSITFMIGIYFLLKFVSNSVF